MDMYCGCIYSRCSDRHRENDCYKENKRIPYHTFFCADTCRILILFGGDELKKHSIAVCEKDEEYTRRLRDYIAKQEGNGFEVLGFSKEEDYLKAEEEDTFDLLIFGENFFQISKPYEEKEKVIFLSEGGTVPDQEGIEILFKYQSADNLLRGIHYLMGNMMPSGQEKKIFSKQKKMIAIYSTWNHRIQTPFALAAAEELSLKKKVLYLNFSTCRGFCKSIGIEKGMDMGDIFYLLREGEKELEAKFKSGIYAVGNFSVIPPPENPEHYMEWTKEEVEQFFIFLIERTEYEILILDIGCMIPGFFKTLEMSSHIWLLKENRSRKDLGLEELRELFKRRDSGLNERAKEVFLPGGSGREDGAYQVEEFYMGELGRCVRRLLGEERIIGDRTDTQTGS